MKEFFKQAANLAALLLVLVPWALYRLQCLVGSPTRAFPGWSQLFSLLPGQSGVYLRRAFYRLILPRCGTDCCISFGTIFSHPTASIGEHVYVGSYCVIGDVTLEDDALVASNVSIANGPAQHGIERLDIPVREQPGDWPRITIGRDTWIGERAVVLANLGQHCVIGAGAVVTREIPDYAIAVGVPAKVVSSRLPPGLAEAIEANTDHPRVQRDAGVYS
ncbi:MAG: acyltransferase [Pirellulales bacterium]|nr:acyltransferase [Pirellulales bacterium]